MQVAELAEIFKVTGSTIRNDLRELENEGLVTRTHG
ncbi:MAG: DeoR family transcriptional regulator, partial [Enterococcus sp.]|nr:DeoR family transcriptional regulator [Enterococcus sp.]